MKKHIVLLSVLIASVQLFATRTTYSFYKADWSSKIGTYAATGSDGWVSDKDATDYSTGYTAASGIPYQLGVHITTTTTGAGATSVINFTDVRKIIVNYAIGSKAKGTVDIRIGNNEAVSKTLSIAEGSIKDLNHDVEFEYLQPQSGKISFSVTCTKNPIYINSITILAQNGSPNITGLTMDSYQLVTDIAQIKDGDELIFGVANTPQQYPYIMGWYDEWNSRNNIYAVQGTYSADRSSVNYREESVYTVHIGKTDKGTSYYAFTDVDGYWLVASGGNPQNGSNNRLTVWDTIYSTSYGWYGAWSMQIKEDGEAYIQSLGHSASNVICFNLNGNTPIFACYKPDALQTPIALYRRTVISNTTAPYIKMPFANFGTVLLKDGKAEGQKQYEINAVNLTADISATLKHGYIFSLDKQRLDRDGDILTISYSTTQMGYYVDTLILESGTFRQETPVILNANKLMTIAEAKQLRNLDNCWLDEVIITKKYDKYIFVADNTGGMLLFDGGNLYGKDRKNGDVLTGVMGKYKNYYGNPSITLADKFSAKNQGEYLPTTITQMPDSADACKFIRFEEVKYNSSDNLVVNGEELMIYDLFGYQVKCKSLINTADKYVVEGIVYYYNQVVFCPTKIEVISNNSTDIDDVDNLSKTTYNDIQITSQIVLNPQHLLLTLYSPSGQIIVETNSDILLNTLPKGIYYLKSDLKENAIKIIR